MSSSTTHLLKTSAAKWQRIDVDGEVSSTSPSLRTDCNGEKDISVERAEMTHLQTAVDASPPPYFIACARRRDTAYRAMSWQEDSSERTFFASCSRPFGSLLVGLSGDPSTLTQSLSVPVDDFSDESVSLLREAVEFSSEFTLDRFFFKLSRHNCTGS